MFRSELVMWCRLALRVLWLTCVSVVRVVVLLLCLSVVWVVMTWVRVSTCLVLLLIRVVVLSVFL